LTGVFALTFQDSLQYKWEGNLLVAKVVPFPQKNGYNVTEVENLIRKWLVELSSRFN